MAKNIYYYIDNTIEYHAKIRILSNILDIYFKLSHISQNISTLEFISIIQCIILISHILISQCIFQNKKYMHCLNFAVGINHICTMCMSETVNLVILTSKCFNICSAVSLISLFFRYLKEVGNEEKFYFLLIQFFLVLRPHLKVAKCDNIFSFWGNRFVQCRYTLECFQMKTHGVK